MKHNLLFILALFVAFSVKAQSGTDYGIVINDIPVTSENCSMITGNGIAGTIKFDPESNTLTLQDASFQSIVSNITEPLHFKLMGENRSWSWFYNQISCTSDLHISGPGHLQIVTYEQSWTRGHCVEVGGSLTIGDNCLVEVYNTGESYHDDTSIAIGHDKTLTVGNAVLQATAVEAGNIILQGSKQICSSPVIICPENDMPLFNGLWVAGMPVTSYNATDISSPYFISGKANYTFDNGTLSLHNLVTSESWPSYQAFIDCNNITIQANGNNSIMGSIDADDVKLSGNGSLSLQTVHGSPLYVSRLSIEDGCKLLTEKGIQGSDIHLDTLMVNNSTFSCSVPLGNLYVKELILSKAEIAPGYAQYDPVAGKFIFTDDISEVLIIPRSLSSIQQIRAGNDQGFFDMQGIKLLQQPTAPGIYVHGRKKVIINN